MSTWLIVEDENDLREMLLLMVHALGFDGLAFGDGEDAVRWISAMDASDDAPTMMPQIALLDIRLPGAAQGTQVSARLRRSNHFHNIPIVLMTAFRLNAEQERDILSTSGANRILYKPLPNPKELRRIFEELTASAG